MSVTVKIEGLKELNDALKKLPEAVAKKHLKAAVGGASGIIKKQVAANVAMQFTERTGTLRRAVYSAAIKELSTAYSQTYFVGVRSGKKFQARKLKSGKVAGSRDAYYWKFLEFGDSKIRARPFLRPAFEQKKMEAAEEIKKRLALAIEKESKAVGKK